MTPWITGPPSDDGIIVTTRIVVSKGSYGCVEDLSHEHSGKTAQMADVVKLRLATIHL